MASDISWFLSLCWYIFKIKRFDLTPSPVWGQVQKKNRAFDLRNPQPFLIYSLNTLLLKCYHWENESALQWDSQTLVELRGVQVSLVPEAKKRRYKQVTQNLRNWLHSKAGVQATSNWQKCMQLIRRETLASGSAQHHNSSMKMCLWEKKSKGNSLSSYGLGTRSKKK